MRSPNHYSVACRAPNGNIVLHTEHVEKTWIGRQKWLMKPFLRGTFALLDTMGLGMRAMRIASEVQLKPELQAEEDKKAQEKAVEEKTETKWDRFYRKNQKAVDSASLIFAIIFSLGFGFALFQATPQVIAEFLVRGSSGEVGQVTGENEHLTVTNYTAEVIKLIFFIGYISLIRRYPAIMDVFRYHGAEHQAINAMEAEQELTAENCLKQTRLHPRCGTNFAIIVFIVSFLLFPLIPRDLLMSSESQSFLQTVGFTLSRIAVELMLLPIVAGISYEIIRLAGKAKDEKWVNIMLWPGLKTQLITTAEPEGKHAEVAIAALEAAVEAEENGQLLNSDDYQLGSLSSGEEPGAPNDDVSNGAEQADVPDEA